MVFQKVQDSLKKIRARVGLGKPNFDYLDDQDLSRFSEQDIILESENQIQQYLPEVLGQALARTWIDKRFLMLFINILLKFLNGVGFIYQTRFRLNSKKKIISGLK